MGCTQHLVVQPGCQTSPTVQQTHIHTLTNTSAAATPSHCQFQATAVFGDSPACYYSGTESGCCSTNMPEQTSTAAEGYATLSGRQHKQKNHTAQQKRKYLCATIVQASSPQAGSPRCVQLTNAAVQYPRRLTDRRQETAKQASLGALLSVTTRAAASS